MAAMAITHMAARLAALLSPARTTKRRSTRSDASVEEQEQVVTGRLLAGRASQREYHREMARLAHAAAAEPSIPEESTRDPRYVLAVVGTMLPEVGPAILCRAFVLARSGAEVTDLVRLLSLTRSQARAIVAAARS